TVDAAGKQLATGSFDKTVRVWSTLDGKLLHTIYVPAGPGNIGRIYAVAMSPEGSILAAGGLTGKLGTNLIYLFDPNTGKMIARIPGTAPDDVHHLTFSANGRYLAAMLGSGELRVFDRENQWSEAFHDTDYAASSYGATFAADGRLATSSLDGKIRLYDR